MKTSSQQWWDSVCDYEGVDDELTTDHPGRSEGVEEDGGVDGEQAGGVVGKENPVKEPKLYFQWLETRDQTSPTKMSCATPHHIPKYEILQKKKKNCELSL